MPQPMGFAILVPNRKDAPLKKKNVNLTELKEFPGSWKIKGLGRIIDATLQMTSETEEMRHFEAIVEYKQWSAIARSATTISGEFDIWQRRSGYAVAINCATVLVDMAASLLSLSIYEDLGGFSGKSLKKDDFITIQKHAFSLGAVMAVLHLRNVKIGGIERSVYNTTGKNIGNEEDLIRAAKKVKRMGFRFPRLGDSYFHFWVADWGGGTLYQPSPFLPHHAVTLAKFFEEALES